MTMEHETTCRDEVVADAEIRPRMSATYSPDDNKLRLYPVSRLDSETYAKVKAAGFLWAPKQGIFVAPAWTPSREDLLVELCGEVGDEDTTLVERAEERADRFVEYGARRAADSETARRGVRDITDRIPFGQPILVGHHSERRARKDAERIENGMRLAVKTWETARYWEQRAAGAIRHAKHKETPAVRHRRIKAIEADRRKRGRERAEAETWLKLWTREGLTLEQARVIANVCPLTVDRSDGRTFGRTAHDVLRTDPPEWSVEAVAEVARRAYPATIAHCDRWIAHLDNRLAYERAMLDEQGGIASDRFDVQVGGRVLARGEWLVVLRVNKSGGKVNGVTTSPPAGAHWAKDWKFGVEKIEDYRPPVEDDAAKVKAATKLPPLCNYPGEGFVHVTQAEWDKIPKDRKGAKYMVEASAELGRHRVRNALGCFVLKGEKDCNKRHVYAPVFITDAKRTAPPASTVPAPDGYAVECAERADGAP